MFSMLRAALAVFLCACLCWSTCSPSPSWSAEPLDPQHRGGGVHGHRIHLDELDDAADGALDPPRSESIALALTIGGRIYAVHKDTGQVLWTRSFDPLLSSQYTIVDDGAGGAAIADGTLFIPSLAGAIYTHTPEKGLERLEATAADIVASSPFLSPDQSTAFMGRIETSLYTIDVSTGDLVRYVSSSNTAHPPSSFHPGEPIDDALGDDVQPREDGPSSAALDDGDVDDGRPLLLLSRADYTIVAVDTHSGAERWNVTISSFNAAAMAPELPQNEFVCTTDGTLSRFGTTPQGYRTGMMWRLKLDSPIAAVYHATPDVLYDDKLVLARVPHTTVVPLHSLHFGVGPTGAKGEGATPEHAALSASGVYIDQFKGQIFAVPRPQVIFPRGDQLMLPSTHHHHHHHSDVVGPTRSTITEDISPTITAMDDDHDDDVSNRHHHAAATTTTTTSLDGVEACVPSSKHYPLCLLGLHAHVMSQSRPDAPQLPSPPQTPTLPTGPTTGGGGGEHPHHSTAPQRWWTSRAAVQWAAYALLFAGAATLVVQWTQQRSEAVADANASAARDGSAEAGAGAAVVAGGADAVVGGDAARGGTPQHSPSPSSSPHHRVASASAPSTPSPSPSPSPSDAAVATEHLQEEHSVVGKLIIFTKRVLGHGSSGTVVYEGLLEGRRVAVKRMLREFYGVAAREIALLMESDEHPCVVSYYAKEEDDEFIYLALYLCIASLESLVSAEAPSSAIAQLRPMVHDSAAQRDTLRQLVQGLGHLHALGIVHRDLKPHNVLVDHNRTVKLSDMGLARKLGKGQTSYTASVGGTQGWQAPELYTGGRVSKAVDMFSLGCVIYFVLSDGMHPFGESFERELNIRNSHCDLTHLPPHSEGYDLVSFLLQSEPSRRLRCDEVLSHPFFWTQRRKLDFMRAASDRIEVEKPSSGFVKQYEKKCRRELGPVDWKTVLDEELVADLGKFRVYRSTSYRDLIRVLRNKAHHFRDLPKSLQEFLGGSVESLLDYFDVHFPGLFMVTFRYLMWKCRGDNDLHLYFGAPVRLPAPSRRSKTAPAMQQRKTHIPPPPGL